MRRLASVRFIPSVLPGALLFAAISLAAISQASTKPPASQDLDNVTLTGRVLDQNGAVIAGAAIEVVLATTGATRTAVTDDAGSYRIIQLEPGVYNLRASFPGFAPQEKTQLIFIAGKNVQLELTLVPEGVTVDPITVTADDTPAVDTTRTVVGGTVTSAEVESLPINSRSPLDLIFTLPGVS